MHSDAMPRRLVLLLAAACGIAAANLYYAQPLLAAIAHEFHASTGQAGAIVTLTQVGYALALAFVVPLGDILERRALVTGVLLLAAGVLVATALAPNITVLALLGLGIGVTSVVVQVLVPFAADLAPAERRGRVVGTVMSGLLIGILLARTASGVVAAAFGWRAIYVVAAVLMLLLSAVLRWALPVRRANSGLGYGQVLRSVLTIAREEPLLRLRALYGALAFASFNVFWTTAAFLLAGRPYGYGTAAIGAFGLLGVAGALIASVAGRLVDTGHERLATGVFAACLPLAFLILWLGAHLVVALIVGIVVLDLGVQGLHITNQSVVYSLRGDARSRLTTAYMTSYFAGGALGSAAAVALYSAHGWDAVCLLGGIVGLLALGTWLLCSDVASRTTQPIREGQSAP
jgi:predicted MFS family arabinose efflux permease